MGRSRIQIGIIMAVFFYEQPIFSMERSMFPQHQGLVQLRPSQHHRRCHTQRLENYLDLMDQILDKAEMQMQDDVKKHSETQEAETVVEVAIDTGITSDEDNTEVDAKEKKFKKTT